MIVLGIDPGPENIAWAEVDCAGRRPRYLAARHEAVPFFSLLRSEIGLVSIEWPDWSPLPNTPAAEIWARARDTIATALVAGGCAATASAVGFKVEKPSAHDIRRAICGKRRPTDAEVRSRLPYVCDGLPRRTNSHVRDAVATAIVGFWKHQRKGATSR